MTTNNTPEATQPNTPDTKAKTPKEKAPKEPKVKASAAKPDGASESTLAGYAAVFKDWEPIPTEEGPVTINPAKIIAIFDVRSHIKPIGELLVQCAGGIKTPIGITQMRYVGETNDLPVHPDGESMVHLVKGSTYNVMVYGRRRTRVAIKLSFKEIHATMTTYKSWRGMVHDAYVENDAREDMDMWDRACFIKNLADGGMIQDDIALEVKPRIAASSVSQYLGVFDMPEAVRKLFQHNSLGVSAIRALRPLRKDEAVVTALATRAVAKNWTEDEIKEAVKVVQAKAQASAAASTEAGDRPRPVAKSKSYDEATLSIVKTQDARKALNWLDTRLKRQRAKSEPDPVAVAKAKGMLEGFMLATGLKDIPAAALADDPPEAE